MSQNETDSTQRERCDLCYPVGMQPAPLVRITVDGKLALTVEQAAERVGVTASTMRGELTRYHEAIAPVADLDGRKKLYLAKDIDRWWKSRPGRSGVPGPRAKRNAE